MKQTTPKADTPPAKHGSGERAARDAAHEETDRRIDRIVERHRETLERLARD